MSVLRLRVVGIEFRQTHVGNLPPLSGTGFDIAIILSIERMFLNTFVKLDSIVQCLAITCSTGIFRQSIDSKADSVELFLGVEGMTLVVNTPVNAPVIRVNEVVDDIALGTSGSIKVELDLMRLIGLMRPMREIPIGR